MALFFADLVRETCWSTGDGGLALSGALPGHRTFADTVPPGARFHYAIAGVTHADEWETGEGEIVGGLLARDPIASSEGGAAVDFSTGLKTVALTVCADWFAERDGGVAAIGDVAGLEEALAGKAAAAHHHDSAYQPLDSDLSAIASVATTAFGRAHLSLADAAALRSHAGLGSIAVQPASNVSISGGSVRATGQIGADDPSQSMLNLLVAGGSDVQIVASGGHVVTAYAETHVWRSWSSAPLMSLTAGGLAVGGAVSVGGGQVVAARRTGWSAPSGTASRATFDTASVTTEALAERVKALIDDLAAHGLIGS